jgi:hypothetical protein
VEQSDKLFILIDKRLSRSQQAVQSSHAAIEFALKYGQQWKHESLVLLAVDGGDELEQWCNRFNESGYKTSCFRESYYQNRMTAVVCHGCDGDVKELRLL